MRHRKRTVKLGRTSAHREAMLAGLVCDLIQQKVPGFKPVWTARKAAEEIYEAILKQGLELDE